MESEHQVVMFRICLDLNRLGLFDWCDCLSTVGGAHKRRLFVALTNGSSATTRTLDFFQCYQTVNPLHHEHHEQSA